MKFTLTNKILATILVLVVLVGIGRAFSRGAEVAQTSEQDTTQGRAVTTESVQRLSQDIEDLSVIGTVTSVREASVQAESQGEVTALNYDLGDFVTTGSIIATIKNDQERATLLQAEAALESARASADISSVGQARDEKLLDEARNQAITTLTKAHDTVYDIVSTKFSPLFENPNSPTPRFTVRNNNQILTTTVINDRIAIEAMITSQQSREVNDLTLDDITSEIITTKEEIKIVARFVDDVVKILNQAIITLETPQSTINSYRTTAAQAQTTLADTLSGLSATRDLISTRQAQLEIARKQGTDGQTTVASAALKQAEANYAIAEAAFERTLIRAPLSGTINSLSIDRGDFISFGQPIAVIANNNALEVRTFVTDDDRVEIARGSKALIEGRHPARITRIAPALDPITKKIEVRLALSGSGHNLFNGQSVRIAIQRDLLTTNNNTQVSLPLAALKIGVTKIVIFTVGNDNRLIEHPVVVGPLVGSKIIILEGVTPDMQIVTDARGLKAGDLVSVSSF